MKWGAVLVGTEGLISESDDPHFVSVREVAQRERMGLEGPLPEQRHRNYGSDQQTIRKLYFIDLCYLK